MKLSKRTLARVIATGITALTIGTFAGPAGALPVLTPPANPVPAPTIPTIDPAYLVGNKGFEAPRVADNTSQSRTGSLGTCRSPFTTNGVPNGCWQVARASVDVADDGVWQSAAGQQSVDLNSNLSGAMIRQAVRVVPNLIFTMSFRVAVNPTSPASPTLHASVSQRSSTGTTLQTDSRTYFLSNTGKTRTSMGYVTKTITITTRANAHHVVLTFDGGTSEFAPNGVGAVIDEVNLFHDPNVLI